MSSAVSPHRGQASFPFFTSHAQFRQYNAALCSGTVPEWTRVNFAGAVPQERQAVLVETIGASGGDIDGRMADEDSSGVDT